MEHLPGALPLLQCQDTATATCTRGKQEALALCNQPGDAPGPEAGKELWMSSCRWGHTSGAEHGCAGSPATRQQPAFTLHPHLRATGT